MTEPAPTTQETELVSTASSSDPLVRTLLYGLSLPERLVRSAVGVTAGTAKELAEFVVPQAFQNSKSYEIAVRNSLGFLVSGVGTVSPSSAKVSDSQANPPTPAPDVDAGRLIARKAAGSFMDIAGLATLHLSPIWVLAIVSDVAYGSQEYLHELGQELQKQGLIDDSSTIHKVDDLFAAIKNTTGQAASHFDLPPLSIDELKQSVVQLRHSLGEIDPTHVIPEAEIRKYWNEMRTLANQEEVSLLGLSGAVAMQTVETIKSVTQGTMTGLFVAGKIINRGIFQHYADSLSRIREQGLWSTVRNIYTPYVELAWGNFTSSRKSWTEQVLDPGNVAKAWNTVKGWFVGRDEVAPERAASPEPIPSTAEAPPPATGLERNLD